MGANLECGSLLPLSARLLAGALGAAASCRPRKREQAPALQIDATLTWRGSELPGAKLDSKTACNEPKWAPPISIASSNLL